MPAPSRPDVRGFFDEATNTVSYLVSDPVTRVAAVIDPVLDYDQATGKASVRSADAILKAAEEAGLRIAWVLETHAHADHLSAAPYIKLKTGAKVGIGEHIKKVQQIFRPVFNALDVSGDGSEFDHLFKEGEEFKLGGIAASVIYTPGHTPACVSYKIGDAVFIGDTLFMPDYGTARADFPGGDARALYRSIQKLLALPGETRVFVCHDYKPESRDHYAWETTIAAERENLHIAGKSEDEFVTMREARDAKLAAPLLLLPSIQTNIRAGKLPPADANGVSYFKIPVELTTGT
ncbi:MAG TPA: MBL fold metallo-hydrolase [Bauldia sp.]|nr:MBL fold metallo-hydrolase [Bauldia sp.]